MLEEGRYNLVCLARQIDYLVRHSPYCAPNNTPPIVAIRTPRHATQMSLWSAYSAFAFVDPKLVVILALSRSYERCFPLSLPQS